MGLIYLIENKLNHKKYIGKTKRDMKTRIRDHQKSFNDKNKRMYNFKLYEAMRKYGFENFEFSIIEECNDDVVNEKEEFYIDKYNTCLYGYNTAVGGDGKHLINNYRKEAFKILYENGWVLEDIAKATGNHYKTISKILRHDYGISTKENANNLFCKAIKATNNLSGETMRFSSLREAANYIIECSLSNGKTTTLMSKINQAVNNSNLTAYGFRWEFV